MKKPRRTPEERHLMMTCLDRGRRLTDVARQFGVNVRVLRRWRTIWKTEHRIINKHGTGRPRLLSGDDVQRVIDAHHNNPHLTNVELVGIVGKRMSPQTAGKCLQRMGINRKRAPSISPKSNVRQMLSFYEEVREVPWSQRVYVDEYALCDSVSNQKYTLYVAMRLGGAVHDPLLRLGSPPAEADFVSYVKETLTPLLRETDVVIWDRYGKSNAAALPTTYHYNPEAVAAIASRGCRLLYMPPKKRHFDPMESIVRDVRSDIAALQENDPDAKDIHMATALAFSKVTSARIKDAFARMADGKALRTSNPSIFGIGIED